ncbi:MAG: T9SS type A sorting domain-containing protein, partial [bacterium]
IIFRNGGIDIICSDSIDARGDINLNGIPNEIGDAVVFTNYFISGLAAFTINLEGQIAATEVNGDGIPLSVADLVYLIRVIVGDALPYAKVTPGTVAEFYSNGKDITVKTPVDIGGALFVFEGEVTPMLADDARDMELKYATVDGMTRVLVYSMERGRLTSGSVLTLSSEATLISVEAATYYGSILETRKNFVPTEFGLSQNYPNPFNPTTTIELALPVASDWSVSIYNVSGQRVAAFSGHSPAGVVTVNWDAANMASGLYFYKAEAGAFSATKKMVLLK